MDESVRHFNPNPLLSASFFSKWFYWWLNPLFKKGSRQELEIEDMYNVTPQDSSDHLGAALEKEWLKEVKKKDDKGGTSKPSLLKVLMRLYGFRYFLLGTILFTEEAIRVVQPLLLGGLIQYFTPNSSITDTQAYMYAFGVSLCAIVIAIVHHPYFFCVQRLGMQMRIACCSLMFKKALRLSNTALGHTTTGHIVNLMSNDVNRFDRGPMFLHILWIGPLQAIAVLVILWFELGPSALAGFVVLLLLIPVQGIMGKLFTKLRHHTAVHTDERVKVMNEIITGMRVIKMYCWEKAFGKVVEKLRQDELRWSWRMKRLDVVRGFFDYLGERLLTAATLIPFFIFGSGIQSHVVFTTIMYTGLVHRIWVMLMMEATELFASAYVSSQRIQFPGLIPFLPETLKTMPGKVSVARYSGIPIIRSEMDYVWAKKRVNAFTSSVWLYAHRVLSYALVVVHVLNEGSLRVAPLYIGLAFMFLMAYYGIGCVFDGVSRFSEFSVASARIQKFLLLDELDEKSSQLSGELRPKPESCRISIENLTAKWNTEVEQNTLEQISVDVQAGQLLAVIGPVGAGKSSLLMALLGELQASSGKISMKGKVTYVSQQAWVFSGSLRQNILFGSAYDKGSFDKVVRASALHKDLEIMPQGDSTLIGDRGVSLSGGQRARVNLARAMYTDADIFLLDDPLSAVDAAVGCHIFNKCIQGVLRKKIRILVTHQLQYLTAADSILILQEGKAIGLGTYEELSNSGIDFAELLKSNEEKDLVESPLATVEDLTSRLNVSYCSHLSIESAISDFVPEAVQLPEEEERQKGSLGIKVYVEYFKAGAGIFMFLLMVLLCIVAQCTYIMSDWWLSRWSTAEEDRHAAIAEHQKLLSQGYNQTNITIPIEDNARNIYIFTGIIIGVFVFGILRALLFFRVAVNASQTLHNRMFGRILRSPISFFDTNPVGRVLNRFAKDTGHMDDNLPVTFFDFVQCLLLVLGIVLVAGVVNPYVFIPTLPILLFFFYIRNYYLSTSRSVQRLEGTCRSPVFSYLSAALQGLHTIRAFNMQDRCQEEFDAHQDLHSEAWLLILATGRWLALRLDCLCALFVTTVAFCAVFAARSLEGGLVGLSVTYSMTLMGLFQWGVRQSAEVENQMISVERILEYSHLPSEAALESEEKDRPPDNWPSSGSIQADNVCLQYSPDAPVVLKNLTFHIKEREKVGIVGRTGAGKSSLITALFRLVEPSGGLSIDGVDILHLGLHDLRSTISIIPQDPVLFSGTLRKNLDPFLQHADQQLWKALSEVQLKTAVEELPSRLETSVSEGGVNFSVGQRQLICLARAILRKNRILLIDEATANVDPRTDELIQETIRDKFSECTVLTIAHRLHTIMDSDRVMVLSDGQIMEFDAPHVLLQRGSGMFCNMVQQVGKSDFEHLKSIAAAAYSQRHHQKGRVCPGIKPSSDLQKPASPSPSSCEKPHKVSQQQSVFNDMILSAPLAVAESYHSLLKYDSEEEGDDTNADNDDMTALGAASC